MSASLYQTPPTIHRHRRLHPLPVARNGVDFFNLSHPQSLRTVPRSVAINPDRRRIRVFYSGEGVDGNPHREVPGELSWDAFLSFAEVLFTVPPTVYSVLCVAGMLIPGAVKPIHLNIGSKTFASQFVLLACAVVIGTLIRRRQWGRICRQSENGVGVDLLARIEKVEEDLRSSATIVRVLSRQLEKLGIRFRVTRKALKEPITEAAFLAQKNSEATRALALQEDILEKELGEIQKVLLAMQDQQHKQLDLILAIGKACGVLEGKRDATAAIGQGKNGGTSVPERRVNNLNTKEEEDTAEPIVKEHRI
ncbi:uncharacterized protein M6B38_262840 [Iris pallida]|uniref:Uncharacterized protein n=1 Tax=Iris pallida TaxID=29817 RepID=A0AAX6ICN5_IRIPA|nr:uncharacterized protein M6B38_262840 [Iris pallida]